MRRPPILAVAALLLAGCHVGTKVEEFPPARAAEGLAAEVRVPSGRVLAGELLEVTETAIVLRHAHDHIVRIPYGAIRDARFPAAKGYGFAGPIPPMSKTKETLRRLSRFPQGLSPELLARLLEAYGQTAVEDVRP
jgi:hypothetical protein